MMSLSKLIEQKIDSIPFLRENLSDGLVNTSALARKIKPEIEDKSGKKIKDSTIIMAIGRLPLSKHKSIEKKLVNLINDIGDIVVRSNLIKYNFNNYLGIAKNQSAFLEKSESFTDSFYTVSRGINETTLIINAQLQQILEKKMDTTKILSRTDNLSAITMKLPDNNTEIEGIYYYILKKLAWKSITIEEVISTTNEFTVVIKSSLVSKAFDVLINLKED